MTSPAVANAALARFASLATIVLVVTVLYVARDVLVPIALALLLSFVLAPLVRWLERRGLQRSFAMLAVVITLFAAFGGLGWLATRQIVDLATSLPAYRENLYEKFDFLAGSGAGAMQPLGDLVQEVRGLFESPEESPDADQPVPVTLVDSGMEAVPLLRSLLGPLVYPLTTAGIVFVLVLFMLIAWDSLRDRLLRLSGNDQLGLATDVTQDAASRVSHYLLAQFLVNVSIGIVIGVGLFLLGMPNAVLWGLLSALLRYIPFVGGVVASLLPITVSIVTSPGWTQPLLIIGLILLVELISNNLVEPWLYGHNTGLSSIGILAAAIFWGWLWGGVGLILATPLTVCLVVMSRHIPQLSFIHVLLSKDEPLSPPERLYQRLLALDAEEAAKVVVGEGFDTLDTMYDQLIGPSLDLAERGSERLSPIPEKQRFVYENLRCFIDDVNVGSTTETTADASEEGLDVLCIAARSEADELVARMFARALRSVGHRAVPLSANLTTSDVVEEIATRRATVACVSALHPFSLVVAGELCRSLRGHYPELRIVAGVWGLPKDAATRRSHLKSVGADEVAGDIKQIFTSIGQGQQPLEARPAVAHSV